MDNGFDKACPSGNHMTEDSVWETGHETPLRDTVDVGSCFKDENGVVWEVYEIKDHGVKVYPYEDQKRFYTWDQLEEEMERD